MEGGLHLGTPSRSQAQDVAAQQGPGPQHLVVVRFQGYLNGDPLSGEWLPRRSPHGSEAGPVGSTDSDCDLIHAGPTAHPETLFLYTSPSPRDGLLSRMPSSA